MSDDASRENAPPRYLSTLDAVSVVIGVVIGSGIFKTTPLIAQASGTPAIFLGVWLVGGLIALCGALCFAELGVRYPREGGVYVFLRNGLGRRVAVFYGLCDLLAIHPATIGMMAFVHAEFAVIWAPLPGLDADWSLRLHATLAIVVLASLNLLNLRGGSVTQNVLSLAKVVGLSLAFVAGCVAAFSGAGRSAALDAVVAERAAAGDAPALANLGLGMAMLFVLFTYGGWNDLLFIAGEIEEPRRKLRRALALGVVTIATIYLLLNVSFLGALGLDGVAASRNVVADVVGPILGGWGTKAVAILVSLCALGALNACIFTGSRVYVALGQDVPIVGFFRRWSGGTPRIALVVQALTALAMILALRGADGFETLLTFSTPFFWSFMALVGVVYFLVIQRNQPTLVGSLQGVVYLAASLYLVYCSFTYAWGQEPQVTWRDVSVSKVFLIAAGLALLLAGAAFFLVGRRSDDDAAGERSI